MQRPRRPKAGQTRKPLPAALPARALPAKALVVGALAALGLAPGAPRSEAYRLYDNGAIDYVVASDEAVRWAPNIWGPGSNLSFGVADSPEWAAIFGSTAQFISAIEEGLARWGDIETADIRWSVSGTTGTSQGAWTRDGASTVFLNTSGDEYQRGAGLWFARDRSRAVWDIAECDIGVPRSWRSELQGIGAAFASGEFAKWFGYCLGLGVSARLPSAPSLDGFGTPWTPTSDRDTGASLLRPRSGWRESVGSISGSVESDGEPASYTHVWAFRTNGSNGVGNPIGAFANRSGAFTIEGLPPGDYVLWAHPINGYDNRLAGAGIVADVGDAVLALPVTVTAGGTARGPRISMQRGR